jgi:hypothetical protein
MRVSRARTSARRIGRPFLPVVSSGCADRSLFFSRRTMSASTARSYLTSAVAARCGAFAALRPAYVRTFPVPLSRTAART